MSGLSLGRFLALKIYDRKDTLSVSKIGKCFFVFSLFNQRTLRAADASRALAPNPYTVSVGKATSSPARMRETAFS
jgi:hypothetical protein